LFTKLDAPAHHDARRKRRRRNLKPPNQAAYKLRAGRPRSAGIERRDRLGGLILHEYSLAA
jgi:hypothetical protein